MRYSGLNLDAIEAPKRSVKNAITESGVTIATSCAQHENSCKVSALSIAFVIFMSVLTNGVNERFCCDMARLYA